MAFSRAVYWNAQGGSVAPLDHLLGIDTDRYSVGVREMACRLSLHEAFVPASKTLARTAQLSISPSALRDVVARQGRRVKQSIRSGQFGPGWTSEDCTDQTLIVGADGVMVPTVTDGAAWIARQLLIQLVMLDKLSNHLRRHRQGAKHEAPASLRQYVAKRVHMTDDPSFRRAGYECGSGPTESFCKTLAARLKGRGMRWDKDNAEGVMALGSVHYSDLWRQYWAQQRVA